MGFLDNLFGDQNQGQQRDRDELRDFANRYQQGSPYEGYDDHEAVQRYQQVTQGMSPQMYQESAEEAFSRMSPQERMQFGQHLQQQAQQQGMGGHFQDINRDGVDDRLQDPRYLAQVTGQMEQQQPGILGQLLGSGGGAGGALGALGASGGMGGLMGGGGGAGNMLSNPLAKAALGGIAAIAARKMMDRV